MYITVTYRKERINLFNNMNALLKKETDYWIFTNMIHIVQKKKVSQKNHIILKNASKQMSPNIKR